ncbi:MAG: hypothetical protein ACNA70_02425 [Brevefilum sp.]
MAKPTKYAPHLCTLFMVIAIIGIILGFIFKQPLIPIILLIPTAIYEAYRTEGKSTKTASIVLVVVLFAEIILVLFNIQFNLAEFFGSERQLIGGYWVPLGDLRIVGPTVMAALSVILYTRTRGIYTKWLAAIIFVTSFAIIYLIDPIVFQDLFEYGLQEALRRF